jgi:hypothetical protein
MSFFFFCLSCLFVGFLFLTYSPSDGSIYPWMGMSSRFNTIFYFESSSRSTRPILTELYQTPLKTGVVPQDWKAAHVVPLFKKKIFHCRIWAFSFVGKVV